MQLRVSTVLCILLVNSVVSTFQDLVTKINDVKDALSKKPKQKLQVQPPKDNQEFLTSFNRTNITHVQLGLKQLRSEIMKKIDLTNTVDERQRVQGLRQRVPEKKRQRIQEEGDNIRQVNEKTNITENFYQLDMILTPSQLDKVNTAETARARRQAYKDVWYPQTIWKNRMVNYYFDQSIGSKAKSAIQKAIEFWQSNTCIDFQERPSATNKIRFFVGQGCYSYVGFVGGTQDVSIGRGCESVGTAAHEIGHALGFFHTQSRYDRDTFITIDTANIDQFYVDQFDKETPSTNYNYGMTYDWGSIMHYGAASASGNGRSTMIAKNNNYQDTMGSDIVAFYDVSMMNEHYGCKADCSASSSIKCENGGYPHPRNCQTCQCPRGFGGTKCTERPPGCGETLSASPEFQSFTSTTGTIGKSVQLEFEQCNYLITAPSGKKIEARISSLTAPACTDGCVYGGIELKADSDVKMTGYRYCCTNDVDQLVTSSSNVLPIIGFNRLSTTTFTVQYRYVDGGIVPGPVLDVLGTPTVDETGGVQTTTSSSSTTTTTQRTTTTRSTNIGNPRCQDDINCAAWVFYFDFCRTYPRMMRKYYCPRRCGYC